MPTADAPSLWTRICQAFHRVFGHKESEAAAEEMPVAASTYGRKKPEEAEEGEGLYEKRLTQIEALASYIVAHEPLWNYGGAFREGTVTDNVLGELLKAAPENYEAAITRLFPAEASTGAIPALKRLVQDAKRRGGVDRAEIEEKAPSLTWLIGLVACSETTHMGNENINKMLWPGLRPDEFRYLREKPEEGEQGEDVYRKRLNQIQVLADALLEHQELWNRGQALVPMASTKNINTALASFLQATNEQTCKELVQRLINGDHPECVIWVLSRLLCDAERRGHVNRATIEKTASSLRALIFAVGASETAQMPGIMISGFWLP